MVRPDVRKGAEAAERAPSPRTVSFRDALRVWARVALYSFGGPTGQIAFMHRILVEEERWISERRFLHALNYCMLLPGPEAQQLTVYVGWLMHGIRGGLVAGIFFVIPGFIAILGLSLVYAAFRHVTAVEGLFFGLKAAVLAVVLDAVLRIGKRALGHWVMVLVAILAFIAIFFFDVLFPLIVLGAALLGLIGSRVAPSVWSRGAPDANEDVEAEEEGPLHGDDAGASARPTLVRALRVSVVCLFLWFSPLVLLGWLYGAGSLYVTVGTFFSKAAVVTFGGAYAVLAYIAQEAVETYGWLRPGEMLDGLGMAETTPGPLIQVVQFVGFMGAFRNPAPLDPIAGGILASVITTWVTFVPCFLWIFLGAPYIEYLRGNRWLNAALTTVTAAVVGVILNLAAWFSLHTLFATVSEIRWLGMRLLTPDPWSLDPVALAISVAAFVALFRLKLGMLPVLAGSSFVGLVVHTLFRVGV